MLTNDQLFSRLDGYLAPMRVSTRQRVLTALAQRLARDADSVVVRSAIEKSLADVGCDVDLRDWTDLLLMRE